MSRESGEPKGASAASGKGPAQVRVEAETQRDVRVLVAVRWLAKERHDSGLRMRL